MQPTEMQQQGTGQTFDFPGMVTELNGLEGVQGVELRQA